MKNLTPWFLLLSLLMGMPALALAEDSGTTDTSIMGIEATSLPIENGAAQPSGNTSGKPLPPKPLMQPRGNIPTKNATDPLPPVKSLMENRLKNASGTGQKPPLKDILEKRPQIGTSGKPILPPNMREGMDDRMRGASGTRPFASGTPKELERMKLLKEGKMDRKMEAARAFIKQSGERMRNAIDRLKKLSDRLDGAIVKFKEKGVDTTAAEALIATAKVKVGEAEVAVANAMSAIEAAKPGTTGASTGEVSEATRKAVKDALDKAKEAIDAAHKALVEAVKSLKAPGGVGSDRSSNPGSSTTTP